MNHIIDRSIAGFPIIIVNPKYRIVHGDKTLDINHNEIFRRIFVALLVKPGPFTGNEIKFLRRYLDMTQTEFSKRFLMKDDHARISLWENRKDEPTGMEVIVEAGIRMHMATTIETINKVAYQETLDRMIADGLLKKKKGSLWPIFSSLPCKEPKQITIEAA